MKTGGLISAATQTKWWLLSDTRGSMTIPAIFFFTMLMAVGGLMIDMQRVYGVHGQMQAYVDNVALAAAAELDGLSGALTRSLRAAVGDGTNNPLVAGSQNFATTTTLRVLRVTFLSQLGTDPGPLGATPAAGDMVLCTYEDTSDDGVANGTWIDTNCSNDATSIQTADFVEIRAVPRVISYAVLPIADAIGAFFNAAPIVSQATVALRATAGYKVEVCNNIPMMFCNPSEVNPVTGQLVPNAPFVPIRGQMLKSDIQTGTPLYPGDFALINAFNGNGADDIRDAVARVNPNTFCFSTVTLKPGVTQGPIRQGLNVRFDWYLGNLGGGGGGYMSNPEYAPAPYVTKGLVPNGGQACLGANPPLSSDSVPLPRDDCFMTQPNGGQNCTLVNSVPKMGNGNWARSQYWAQNHPGIAEPSDPTISLYDYVDPDSPVGGWTRYDTYRYEMKMGLVDVAGNENGGAACYSGATPTNNPYDVSKDRRVIIAAVINCVGDANLFNNSTPVPTKTYARLFMTEPMGNENWDSGIVRGGMEWKNTAPQDNYVEMIEAVPPNEDVLHVFPVLYR